MNIDTQTYLNTSVNFSFYGIFLFFLFFRGWVCERHYVSKRRRRRRQQQQKRKHDKHVSQEKMTIRGCTHKQGDNEKNKNRMSFGEIQIKNFLKLMILFPSFFVLFFIYLLS